MPVSKDDLEDVFVNALYDSDGGDGLATVLQHAFCSQAAWRGRFMASALQGILAHKGPAADVAGRVADVQAAVDYAILLDVEWSRRADAEMAERNRQAHEDFKRERHEAEHKALFG
jgi:hypothetical protein